MKTLHHKVLVAVAIVGSFVGATLAASEPATAATGPTFTGQVVDGRSGTPLTGVVVTVAGPGWAQNALTNQTGRFSITLQCPSSGCAGPARIVAHPAHGDTAHIFSFLPGVALRADATKLKVKTQNVGKLPLLSGKELAVPFRAGCAKDLRGVPTVVDSAGAKVVGTATTRVPYDSSLNYYVVRGLPRGDYYVRWDYPGPHVEGSSAPITASSRGVTRVPEFGMCAAVISGRAVDAATGEPIPGAVARIYGHFMVNHGDEGWTETEVPVAADGSFSHWVSGQCWNTAGLEDCSDGGWVVRIVTPTQDYVPRYAGDLLAWPNPASRAGPGDHLDVGTIHLTHGGATLEIVTKQWADHNQYLPAVPTLVDQAGTAVGILDELRGGAPNDQWAHSYAIVDVPAGDYWLRADVLTYRGWYAGADPGLGAPAPIHVATGGVIPLDPLTLLPSA